MGVVLVAALADVRLHDGRVGLLELQEEGIAVVSAQQQDDEGERAHTADADDLHRHIDELVAVDELTVVFLEGPAIVGERLLCHPLQFGIRREVSDERRRVDDARHPVDRLGQLVEGLEAVVSAGLGEDLLGRLRPHAGRRLRQLEKLLGRDPRVVDVEVAHRRVAVHPVAVGAHGRERGVAVLSRGEAGGRGRRRRHSPRGASGPTPTARAGSRRSRSRRRAGSVPVRRRRRSSAGGRRRTPARSEPELGVAARSEAMSSAAPR